MATPREIAVAADAVLLDRFVTNRDADAFSEIVRRHGPMVFCVCRRFLGVDSEAEDAFQATFLVLVRKVRSISHRERLGAWLYGVAVRVAQKTRANAARRRALEQRVTAMNRIGPQVEPLASDFWTVLDEELSRLPDRYRLPFVRCHLQGGTRAEVARELGWSEGTLSSRLSRALQVLRGRLVRRGVAFGAAGLAMGLPSSGAVAVPPVLLHTTTKVCLLVAGGQALSACAVSSNVILLVKGVVRTMFLNSLAKVVAPVMAVGLLAVGGGLAHRGSVVAFAASVVGGTNGDVDRERAENIRKLIADLGSADAETRATATTKLVELAELAVPALKKAAAANDSLAVRKQAAFVLETIEARLWPRRAAEIRLGQVLENNPRLTNADIVRACYLLTTGRNPEKLEAEVAEKRLSRSPNGAEEARKLAHALAGGKAFQPQLAEANVAIFEIQERVAGLDGVKAQALMLQDKALPRKVSDIAASIHAASGKQPAPTPLEVAFLCTLHRFPSPKEVETLDKHLRAQKDVDAAFTDVVWALVNTNEFLLGAQGLVKDGKPKK
ncbi:hypothetical protein AYO40_00850 [Planctomycetaceae bacterium SCGC AG-212-D15]|nr:hypothetical protein AYO40_00850 [Planctomycetaceae bacterium SCGC AG-212-D15]